MINDFLQLSPVDQAQNIAILLLILGLFFMGGKGKDRR